MDQSLASKFQLKGKDGSLRTKTAGLPNASSSALNTSSDYSFNQVTINPKLRHKMGQREIGNSSTGLSKGKPQTQQSMRTKSEVSAIKSPRLSQKDILKVQESFASVPAHLRFQAPKEILKFQNQALHKSQTVFSSIRKMDKSLMESQTSHKIHTQNSVLSTEPHDYMNSTLSQMASKTSKTAFKLPKELSLSRMTIRQNEELLVDLCAQVPKKNFQKVQESCRDILTKSALEIRQIQQELTVIVPSGRKPYDELTRSVGQSLEMIEGSKRLFRLSVGGLKSPLTLKFDYFKEIPLNFTVELSFNERMIPVEATFSCPEKILFSPEMNKDYFPKNQLFIRAISASRAIKCRFTARFPKQDLIEKKETEVRVARMADPDYDLKQQELDYKKDIKKMIQFRVQNLLSSQEKTLAFLKQVQEIQAKRKGCSHNDNTFLLRNKHVADNWRVESPKRRAAIQSYSDIQHSLVKSRRSHEMVIEHKQSIFQANKWEIIKTRKTEMLKKLRYLQLIALRKHTFTVFVQLNLYLKTLAKKYLDVRNERIRAMRRAFASMICSKKFLRRIKKIGPSIDEREKRRVRHNVSFIAASYAENTIAIAQNCFIAFLRRQNEVRRLQQPIYRFHNLVNTAQQAYRKLKTRCFHRRQFLRFSLQLKLKQLIDEQFVLMKKKKHNQGDIDALKMLQNDHYSQQMADEYFKLREMDFLQKRQMLFMAEQRMTTEVYIAANRQVNTRLVEITKLCENLGIVPKGTQSSQLPHGYGKGLQKDQQLFFTFIFKPNELEMLIEKELEVQRQKGKVEKKMEKKSKKDKL